PPITITYIAGSCFQHRMDLPRPGERRADRIQAELAVDVLADRVVDPGDDPGNLENLLGDLGRHDVAVVAVGEGGEAVRRLDARLAEHVLIDSVPKHHLAGKIAAQPVEGAPVVVNHGDLVAGLGEGQGRHGADAAASNDHELHKEKTH